MSKIYNSNLVLQIPVGSKQQVKGLVVIVCVELIFIAFLRYGRGSCRFLRKEITRIGSAYY